MTDEMEIRIQYSNIDDYIPEANMNTRVIKERFILTYYRFTYKSIPNIMICHLVMNETRNFYLFPSKEEVSAHYIPHMILLQRNLNHNIHFLVEFDDYV